MAPGREQGRRRPRGVPVRHGGAKRRGRDEAPCREEPRAASDGQGRRARWRGMPRAPDACTGRAVGTGRPGQLNGGRNASLHGRVPDRASAASGPAHRRRLAPCIGLPARLCPDHRSRGPGPDIAPGRTRTREWARHVVPVRTGCDHVARGRLRGPRAPRIASVQRSLLLSWGHSARRRTRVARACRAGRGVPVVRRWLPVPEGRPAPRPATRLTAPLPRAAAAPRVEEPRP